MPVFHLVSRTAPTLRCGRLPSGCQATARPTNLPATAGIIARFTYPTLPAACHHKRPYCFPALFVVVFGRSYDRFDTVGFIGSIASYLLSSGLFCALGCRCHAQQDITSVHVIADLFSQ